MPSLKDARSVDLSNYVPVAMPSEGFKPSLPAVSDPGYNPMLRCPLPPFFEASPDSLRQFYQPSLVPQSRFLNPSAIPSAGASSGTSNVTSTTNVTTGGTSLNLSTTSISTSVLPVGASIQGGVTLGKAFELLRVAANGVCRLQLYGTQQAQLSDSQRALDVPTYAGITQNIICDLALDTFPYTWQFLGLVGGNGDPTQSDLIYSTVTNIGTAPQSFMIGLTFVPIVMEAQ